MFPGQKKSKNVADQHNKEATKSWRPGAALPALQARAELLGQIRTFFVRKSVMEVETPVIGAATVTDPNIESIQASDGFLQTSPEFHMKRLLADGCGAIYQISKAFRFAERSKRHNTEFTMLEWYRPQFELVALLDEVYELLSETGVQGNKKIIRWKDLFQQKTGLEPFSADETQVLELARELTSIHNVTTLNKAQALDLLFSEVIEPELGNKCIEFVVEYPVWDCALAALGRDEQGWDISQRFEVFVKGVEIGNAYQECWDSDELLQRFELNNSHREKQGSDPLALDDHFIQAVKHYHNQYSQQKCAGVSIGLDRLLMILLDADRIDQVISFSAANA